MPFVATTSLKRLALLLLASAAFVAIGIVMVRYPRPDHILDVVGGWLGIAFFGLCGLVFLVQIVGTHPRLTIDSYGITWTQRSDQTIPWSAIADLNTLTVGRRQNFLALCLVDPDRYPSARKPKKPGPSLSTRLYGGDVHIPLSMLSTSAKDVLSAVAQYWPPR